MDECLYLLMFSRAGIPLKTYCTFSKKICVTLMIIFSVSFLVSCGSQQKSAQPTTPPFAQTEPTIIELDDSRLADVLTEGDIPEENRGDLPWLPNRPPPGMSFADSSALDSIYFEFDKYSLTTQAKNILNNHADWLKSNPEVSIQIEGHCDERGTLEYNQVLGDNRAISVKKYLGNLGIDPDRMYTITYGELRPVDPGHSEESWTKNRRAKFRVSQ